LEFLARTVRQEEELNRKRRSKNIYICKFANDMILYLKVPNTPPKNPVIINTFTKTGGYKINIENSITFVYTNNEQTNKEFRKTFTITSKNIYLGINLAKEVKTSTTKTINH
jgi:hypothetical protein